MHFALTLRQIVPVPHSRLPRPDMSIRSAKPRQSLVTNLWTCIQPFEVWRRLREDHFEQLLVAASLGIGAFVSNVPLGGWQVMLAAYVAWRTHLHVLPATAASLLCISSTGTGSSNLAIGIGYFLLHFCVPDVDVIAPEHLPHWQRLARVPLSWPIGAFIVGFLDTWIVLPVFERLFRLIPVRRDLDDS
jgi:hypothetical protein